MIQSDITYWQKTFPANVNIKVTIDKWQWMCKRQWAQSDTQTNKNVPVRAELFNNKHTLLYKKHTVFILIGNKDKK